MKALIILLLLFVPVVAQDSGIKGNPILIYDVEIKRPSSRSPSYEKPSLEITLGNLSTKPIQSLSFEVEFWDYRHDASADKIKGALGDVNPKYVLLKPLQKKTINHSLSDYYPLDNWTTDKTKLKITYIRFSDGTAWIPEKDK